MKQYQTGALGAISALAAVAAMQGAQDQAALDQATQQPDDQPVRGHLAGAASVQF